MRAFLALSFVLLTLAACDAADPAPSPTGLLTAEPWVHRSDDAAPVGSATRYEFREDGTLRLEFAQEPAEEETWALDADGSVLTVMDGGASRRFTVHRLDAEALHLVEIPAVEGAPDRSYDLVHP